MSNDNVPPLQQFKSLAEQFYKLKDSMGSDRLESATKLLNAIAKTPWEEEVENLPKEHGLLNECDDPITLR